MTLPKARVHKGVLLPKVGVTIILIISVCGFDITCTWMDLLEFLTPKLC